MRPASTLPLDSIAYRPAQAAKLLGVSTRTLLNWAKDKDFPAKKIGRAVLIPRHLLVEWLAKQAFLDGTSE